MVVNVNASCMVINHFTLNPVKNSTKEAKNPFMADATIAMGLDSDALSFFKASFKCFLQQLDTNMSIVCERLQIQDFVDSFTI